MRTLSFQALLALTLLSSWSACIASATEQPLKPASPTNDWGQRFCVADYGARGDGVTDDSAAIQSAIATASQAGVKATVLFEAKRYRVSAREQGDGKHCFTLDCATGITLLGVTGRTELISSSPRAGMIKFTACTNVQVKGLMIDYDPVPFIQGTIVAINRTQGTFNLKLDEGYPEPQPELMKKPWGIVIDRATRNFKPGTPSAVWIRTLTALGNRHWKLALREPAHAQNLSVGDAFAMRNGAEGGQGIAFARCFDGSVEDVTMYATPGLCTLFVQCEGNLVVRRLTVRPRPGTTRLLSGNVDGIHCQMVRQGPLVENCHFEGMTDDGLNTYDKVRMVTEVVSPTELRVHYPFDMRVGDRIQVFDPHTGSVRGEANVTSVTGPLITFDPPIIGVRTSTNILSGITSMTNHLDADVMFNLATCGAGFIIRSNYFGNLRGRGLVLKGINGLVEGNVFERTSGPGISIANEPRWPEGPVPHDIIIRGNQFRHIGMDAGAPNLSAISVMGLSLNGASQHPIITNIRLENNVITDPPGRGISIQSCSGATLCNNRIEADATRSFPSSYAVGLGSSSNVAISNLIINDSRPQTIAGIVIQSSVAAGQGGVTITGLKTDLPSATRPVLDHRTIEAANPGTTPKAQE